MTSPKGLPLSLRGALLGAALAAVAPCAGQAEPIRHPTAVFAGLDKITGRIINFDVAIDETVQFGTLQVTPRVCNTRPQTEAPMTTTFVEVDEQQPKPDQKRDAENPGRTALKYEVKRIFSGWMFASSPGLHGVEHPVYDVWLVNCKGGKEVAAQPAPQAAPQPAADAAQTADKRGRTRKIVPKPPVNPDAAPIGPADEPVFNSTGAAPVDPAAAQQQRGGRQKRQRQAQPPQQPAAPAAPQVHDPFGLF
ncbi:MAG: DUF2155 domain-containing protein [Methylocystis sp.]